MPRALNEIVAELRELVAGDYTTDNLADDLLDAKKSGWTEIFQTLFNRGHKKATAQGGSTERELNAKLEAAQETERQLRGQIKKLEEKVPDSAQLRQEYEQREAKIRSEYETKVNELQNKVTTGFRMTRAQKLAQELASDENLVQPDYAKDIAEGKFADRFAEDEKGSPIVLQLGQRIPYAAQTEDEAIKLLAKDILKTVPTWALRSGAERGGGQRNDGKGGGGQHTPPKDIRTQKVATGDYAL